MPEDPTGGLVPAVELPGEEPEARLLAAAAVLGVARRVGSRGAVGPPPPAPAPPDERPVCGDGAARLLELLLGGYVPLPALRPPGAVRGPVAALLVEWLQRCDTTGRRVPHGLLVPLLDRATPDESLRPLTSAVADARGTWLAERVPSWSWAGPQPDPAEVWRTGSRSERLRVLRALRSDDPAAARDLIATTWTRDPAGDRAAFVEALTTNLSDADEPFLEEALDDRARSVRLTAAGVLDALPSSRRARRAQAWLETLVKAGRRSLEVSTPETLDALPAVGSSARGPDATDPRRDGVTDTPPGPWIVGPAAPPLPRLGRKAWWLAQLVAAAPLEWWERIDEPAKLVKRVDNAAVVLGWTRAASVRRDARWASALLAVAPDPALVAVLDPAHDEETLRALVARTDIELRRLAELLAAAQGAWTPRLTREVIATLRAALGATRPDPHAPLLAATVAHAGHPATGTAQVTAWHDAEPPGSLAQRLAADLLQVLSLREAIMAELA